MNLEDTCRYPLLLYFRMDIGRHLRYLPTIHFCFLLFVMLSTTSSLFHVTGLKVNDLVVFRFVERIYSPYIHS